jgi:glycosyltransferase involved in cell wall biosynthesis
MKRVLVIGPALANSGYSHHTRMVLRSLRELEQQGRIDLFCQITGWANTDWVSEVSEETDWIKSLNTKHLVNGQTAQTPYDISVQVSIPHEWKLYAPINIGVTAGVESDRISAQWIQAINQMTKVVTISSFSQEIIVDSLQNVNGEVMSVQTPVEYVGYPVRKFENVDLELNLTTKFNFITVAQWAPRKNLDSSIKWFVESFQDNPGVGLIVKTHAHNNSTSDKMFCEQRIKNLIASYKHMKCKVYLLHGGMSDAEMHALYMSDKIHCMVSTTSGEGYGLPIFEAAYSGMPVIAPDYSGYKDFLYQPKEKDGKLKDKPYFATVDYVLKPVHPEAVVEPMIIKDSCWAYPKESSFKIRLLEVYKDYGRFKKQASELKEIIEEKYEQTKIFSQFNSFFNDFLDKEELKIEFVE